MKHGGTLKRTTPLRRRTRMKPRRDRRRRSSRWVDDAYRAEVRMLQCCLHRMHPWAHFCRGEIDPHHAHHGRHGVGTKSDDWTCIPLCRAAHDDAEGKRGFFRGWTREQMREWHDARAAETRREVMRRNPGRWPEGEAR